MEYIDAGREDIFYALRTGESPKDSDFNILAKNIYVLKKEFGNCFSTFHTEVFCENVEMLPIKEKVWFRVNTNRSEPHQFYFTGTLDEVKKEGKSISIKITPCTAPKTDINKLG